MEKEHILLTTFEDSEYFINGVSVNLTTCIV